MVDGVQTATITCRVESLTDPAIVGLSVEEVRSQFAEILNIPASASAFVGTVPVDESYVVQEGDKVNFSLPLGEKG